MKVYTPKEDVDDIVRYLQLMVAKALLHLRLGQTDQVNDICLAIFDILDDDKILW